MAENNRKYDLILQNTGSKQEFVIRGIYNISTNPTCYEFDNFEMPENAPEGEYMYFLIYNIREDVTYDLVDDIKESIVHTEEGDVKIKDLEFETGLMKYGSLVENNTYNRRNKDFIYYDRKKG